MEQTRPQLDPYANDPARWAHSMAHHAELLLPCLDATGARLVAEIGAYAGDLTRLLADWAAGSGARVLAIDPSPEDDLVALARERDEVELVRETSVDALPHVPLPDVVIVDGDHNHHVVSEELRLIAERAQGAELPLLLFHDVAWPHARRDHYFDPELVPADRRHPTAGDAGGLFPGDPGLRPGGLPYPDSAAHEGGPGNGVLTAVEDFVAQYDGLRLAVVPVFFGFGAVWHRDAPWAAAVAELLEPWDGNPALRRLEENRVHQIAVAHARQVELWRLQERLARQESVLLRMLESSAFAIAERLSRLRVRAGIAPAQSVISKDEIRRALDG
jgi:SAM-dependent methyltransferase